MSDLQDNESTIIIQFVIFPMLVKFHGVINKKYLKLEQDKKKLNPKLKIKIQP